MIFHPEKKLIQDFANGELTNPLTTMISAHLEQCPTCKKEYLNIFNAQSKLIGLQPYKISEVETEDAFLDILDKLSTDAETKKTEITPLEIEISNEKITLPKSLSFLNPEKINWKEFGNKNAIAPVLTTNEGNLYLIYIGPNEEVPEHGHSGKEYSYVVAGSFNDGINSFNTGDFSITNHQVMHTPKATSSDGCLVLSWVEGRLNFFSGIFSPLNKLLWWYLHRA